MRATFILQLEHSIDTSYFQRRMLSIISLIILLPLVAVTGQVFNPVRINCGGPQYRDPATNIIWLADSSVYNGNKGRAVRKCSNTSLVITNTSATLRNIYCSHQLFRAVGATRDIQPYEYSIPVLNTTSSYIVRLHFAEIVRGYSRSVHDDFLSLTYTFFFCRCFAVSHGIKCA